MDTFLSPSSNSFQVPSTAGVQVGECQENAPTFLTILLGSINYKHRIGKGAEGNSNIFVSTSLGMQLTLQFSLTDFQRGTFWPPSALATWLLAAKRKTTTRSIVQRSERIFQARDKPDVFLTSKWLFFNLLIEPKSSLFFSIWRWQLQKLEMNCNNKSKAKKKKKFFEASNNIKESFCTSWLKVN